MIILSRKREEGILIGDNIEITVTAIHNNHVKLGINAPNDITILRSELVKHHKKTKDKK